MKKILLLTLLVTFAQFSFGQTQWTADPMHTNVRFSVKHNGISFIDGQFTDVKGQMVSPSASNFDGATFQYTIAVKSIDTRISARDSHLLTKDFFYASKYPKIKLRHATLHHVKGNQYTLKGDLTLHGVTKTITFDVTMNGKMTDKKGRVHVGFTATTTLDRRDYNINYNAKLPSGIFAVGKDIKIVVNTELIKQG